MSKKSNKLDILTPRKFNTKAQNRHGKLLEPNSPDEERAYKNAAEIVDMIRKGTLQPSELKAEDRRPTVAYLRLEGYTADEMAGLFKVNIRTITGDLKLLSEDRTKIIKGLDLFEVSGRLIQIAKHLALKARREGSYAASWKIEKELIESLQSLGFVYRAPKTLGVATLHADIREGHSLLDEKIGKEKDVVVEALGNILSSLKGGSRKVRIPHESTTKENKQRSDEIIEISGS